MSVGSKSNQILYKISIKYICASLNDSNSIEIQQKFSTLFNKFRYFHGKVIEIEGMIEKSIYSKDEQVIYFNCPQNDTIFNQQNKTIENIEQQYLFKIDSKNDPGHLMTVFSGGIKAYNILFQKAKIEYNEQILIINPCSHFGYITYQIALNYLSNKGKVMALCKSNEQVNFLKSIVQSNSENVLIYDAKNKDNIREQFSGVGCDVIVDFSNSHDSEWKQTIIGFLGPHGRWVVNHDSFQLDPPDISQLFYKNASLCFSFEEIYSYLDSEMGQIIHIYNEIKNIYEKGGLQVHFDRIFKTLDESEEIFGVQSMNMGSYVIDLTNK